MIASFGGAEVFADGTRNYAGSGGMIGGLSFEGANISRFTGAGKAYESFVPSVAYRERNPDEILADNLETGDTIGGTNIVPVNGGSGTGTAPTSTGFVPPTVGGGYRGLSGITQGGNVVIGALNSIFSAYQSGAISLQQALTYSQQYSGYLNNPSYFYQAQRGDDASLLARLRQQAASIINAITGWTAPVTDGGIKPPITDTSNTKNPLDLPQNLLNLLATLGATPKTKVEAAPNLYSFTPTGTESGSTNNTMRNLVILGILAVVGYFAYKRYM